MTETIYRKCPACGSRFGQPNDPGRKRVFCSGRCRQADYRTRTGKTGHEAEKRRRADEKRRQEQQARDNADREQRQREERTRSRARQSRQSAYGTPADWWSPRTTDTPSQAKARATCARLMERAEHSKTTPHEAEACRTKAEELRAKKGLS